MDWTPPVAPPEPDSYRAMWFKLRYQRSARVVVMDPFAEPVKLILPV